MSVEQAALRRSTATRTVVRYFSLAFLSSSMFGGLVAFAVWDERQERATNRAVRIEYCMELEKLKTQNREDVAERKKHYARNLRLLGLKDSKELRNIAEEGWDKDLARNTAKPCPYTS